MRVVSEHWFVSLSGDRRDLAYLSKSLTGHPCFVGVDDGLKQSVLWSSQFNALTNVHDVFAMAEAMAATLSGIVKLRLRSSDKVSVGGAYRYDEKGNRSAWARGSAFEVSRIDEAGPALAAMNGTEYRPPSSATALEALAEKDAAVRKYLVLLTLSDADSWTGLYRIFELLRSSAGKKGVNRYISKTDENLFRRTANHPAASGDLSRHGHSTDQPPLEPMPLPSAQRLIARMAARWIRDKDSEAIDFEIPPPSLNL